MPTANDLLSLLARASDLLGSTLEPDEVIWSLSRLVVPALADWSIVSLVDAGNRPSDVQSWHRDAAKRPATRTFAEHRFGGRTEVRGSLSTMSSGEPFVLNSDAEAYARKTLRAPEALTALDELDLESVAVVPMLASGEVIGLITLARGSGRPAMTSAEVDAAVDLARRASVTLGNARSYERERSASEKLQRSLLTDPVAPAHLEVVTRYVPAAKAAQIGGDWYDVFTQPEGQTVLVVGDVAGHDLAAAAMMGQLRSMLRGIAVTTGSGPAQLLTDLDRAIEALDLDACATAVVCQLGTDQPKDTGALGDLVDPGDADDPGGAIEPGDETSLRLTYSNAGHPAPVLQRADGSIEELECHDTMLGVVPQWSRRQLRAVLRPGDTLVLYSDGLVESRRDDLDVGLGALRGVLSQVNDVELSRLVDRILGELVPRRHDDDVAVLAVRLR